MKLLTSNIFYLYLNSKQQKEIAHEFRCNFTNKFTEHEYNELKTEGSKDYETSKEGFCSAKVWADEVMIKHASKILNLNLIFIDLTNNDVYCGVHGKETIENALNEKTIQQPMGIVAWVNKSHFEPFVRIDNASKGIITTLFEPSKSEQDKNFVEALVENYMSSCKIIDSN